ncbi:MAG: hypothetical protein PHV16_00940 [Candidatus Nanoarchaeia archaeon]|nr:hypothetical protein [Candidatus Nanoarchaeia archaeon]
MKIMIVFIGLLTIMAGVLPFFNGFGIIPSSGPIYSGIIVIIGLIALWYGIKALGLWGSQKFIVAVIGIFIILGGLIPFLVSMSWIPSTIPSSGMYYSGIIIAIGLIALFYGFKKQF